MIISLKSPGAAAVEVEVLPAAAAGATVEAITTGAKTCTIMTATAAGVTVEAITTGAKT